MLQKEYKVPLMAAATASIVCLLLYLPVLHYGFITLDDPDYVLNNQIIRQLSPESLARMLFQTYIGWWMPLTWITLAVDYHFWGLNPVGYHLTNIVLHAVNTGLVVLIADAACRAVPLQVAGAARPRWYYAGLLLFVGLFFGVHPLRVESVAWVTERKDVLNGLFAFSSVLFYLKYAGRKDGLTGGKSGQFYVLSLICFICSLMAKSVTVVLPAILVVLDWGLLGRQKNKPLQRLVAEKWPFWVVSAIIIVLTISSAAQSRYLVTYDAFPFGQRLVVSGNAIWEYFRLLCFPVGLSPFYVIPDPIPVSYTVTTVSVALALAWLAFAGKVPRFTACIVCFILPLLPVLAFFQNGDQAYADRFTYLPSLSPAIFLALLGYRSSLADNIPRRRLAIAAAVAVIALFMAGTCRQLKVWQSPETLWTRIIKVDPLAISYKERGRYYHDNGRYAEAVADFTAALERVTPTLKPYEYNFYAFRAESLRMAGKLAEAVSDFDRAIGQHPHPAYYYHRGLALRAMGRTQEADEDLRRAGPDAGPIGWFD